jgi:hypothetical protein
MNTQTKNNWTVFFLIRALSDVSKYAEDIITELLKKPKPDSISIIICINIKVNQIPDTYQRGDNPPNLGTTNLFYQVVNSEMKSKLSLIDELPCFDIRNEDDVAFFLRQGILQNNVADHYMIFTWDHGSPFAIFTGKDDNNTPLGEKASLSNEIVNCNYYNPLITHFRQWEFYQSVMSQHLSVDHETLETYKRSKLEMGMLTVSELKNAIKWAFGKIKVDILVMGNCNLQFFDTGYELSSCVNYLVAFESYMYVENMLDYETILKTLTFEPVLSPKKIAQIIVSSFEIKANSDFVNGDNNKDIVALFANDLSWYPTMAKLIDDLANRMIEQLPVYRDKILNARKKCEYIKGRTKDYCLIDFKAFLNSLFNELPAIFEGTIPFFNYVLDKIILQSYVGSYFQKRSEKLQCPSCFSIYFPADWGIYDTVYQILYMNEIGRYASSFVKEFRWDSFIKEFVTPPAESSI